MEDTRLESFPFDSKKSGYDDYGYPIYDRAVGASMLRQTFAKFFSNGVFDAPTNAFEISKGSGLKVNIAEGIAIINGAMASVPEGGIAVSLTDESTTAGTYAYGLFLRYDENSDKRSCYITIRKGEAGASPTPPEPERSAPGICELRIGYVVVPTGSSDLSGATITNEKGLEYCPFAFPFEEIDLSSVTADAKASANEALTYLLDYFEQYKEMIDAAVDETLAGQLQTQINELKEQLDNFDLSGSVDNETIVYSQKPGGSKKTLHVPSGGIGTKELANNSITYEKLNASNVEENKFLSYTGTGMEWKNPEEVIDFKEKMNELLKNATILWSGSGSSSINVPGVENYRIIIFEVDMNGYYGTATALRLKDETTVYASGNANSHNGANSFWISAEISKDKLDLYVTSWNVPSNKPDYIKSIYGVA